MLKLCFILFFFGAFPAAAQDTPPSCRMPYQDVDSYGTWHLENGVWKMPFTCSVGVEGEVNVKQKELSEVGIAVYYITVRGEPANFTRFPVPCEAMFQFCRHQVIVSDFGFDETFYE